MKALKTGSVSSTDVARGKEQLKEAVARSLDSTAGLFENIRTQALLTGQVQSGAELLAAIDAVSDADVKAVSFLFNLSPWNSLRQNSNANFLLFFMWHIEGGQESSIGQMGSWRCW